MNTSITVTNKSELENAYKNKYETIIVRGDFAVDLWKSKEASDVDEKYKPYLGLAGAVSVGDKAAAIKSMTSTEQFAEISEATGIETEALAYAAMIGIKTVCKAFSKYEIEFSESGEPKAVLYRK